MAMQRFFQTMKISVIYNMHCKDIHIHMLHLYRFQMFVDALEFEMDTELIIQYI